MEQNKEDIFKRFLAKAEKRAEEKKRQPHLPCPGAKYR